MKPTLLSLTLGAGLVLSAASSQAAQNVAVNGSLSDTPLGGGVFGYTLSLKNTGTESIDNLWFGWIPGVFNVANPTVAGNLQGWSSSVVSSSIQYGGSSGTAIAPGATGTFTFDSTSTPAQFMAETSGESWAYGVNAPAFSSTLTGDIAQFFPQVVPEPSTLGLAAIGAMAVIGAIRRKIIT